MKYKIALIIGRFQPFHLGHLYLLKKTLKIAEKVVVGIGSASLYDENNPLDYETREKIIKAVFYKEKIEDRLLKIVPLEDFFNDKKWLDNVKIKTGKFNVVVSNNDWTNNIFEKANFQVKRFPYYKRKLYEGWRIRKLIRQGKKWKTRIPDYLIAFLKKELLRLTTEKKIFNHIAIGGTFDHFHKGHKSLINTAFENGKKVTIGIATEELYRNKLFFKTIESYKIRKKSVSEYLVKKSWRSRASIISFSDFTGGADKKEQIDAIVVSRLTYQNALRINELREKNKLNKLRIIIIKDVLTEDEKILSSERIRSGEVNRKGEIYKIKSKKDLLLPEHLREELRKPLGGVYKNIHQVIKLIKAVNPFMIIAVGDVVVDSLLINNIDPEVKIIDFKSRRKDFFLTQGEKDLLKQKKYINKPGTLNLITTDKLKKLIHDNNHSWLVVEGEEDLLTLPAILFAPLNSLVLYGHWQYGVIGIRITEKVKNKVSKLITLFLN